MVERVTVFRCQKCLTVFPRELQAVQGGPGSCRKSKRISRTPKPPFSAGRKIRSGITFRFAKHEKECKGALKWVCDECDQGFKQKGLLKRHKARTHGNETRYCEPCDVFVKLGYHSEGWKLHQARKHTEKVECPRCTPVPLPLV